VWRELNNVMNGTAFGAIRAAAEAARSLDVTWRAHEPVGDANAVPPMTIVSLVLVPGANTSWWG
jgi:hypothetical protein